MTTRSETLASYAILIAASVLALFPIVIIVLLALEPSGTTVDSFPWPTSPDFGNFSHVWKEGMFGSSLVSSFIIAATVSVVATLLSVMSAYSFGTMEFRGRSALFYFVVLGVIVPYEAMVIPLYYDFREIGLTDSYFALILPQIGLSVAFGTFWLRAFFLATPRSLLDAARVDGANEWTILWRILVPAARPAILALGTLLFIFTWNEFLLALVMIQDESIRTAPVSLAFFSGGQRTNDLPLVAAAAVLVAGPVLAVYIALQRSFVRGMLGAVSKG